MDIFEVTRREWPTTMFAWYGDSSFSITLLDELGWRITSEIPVESTQLLESLCDDVSDTLEFTKHTDRILQRSVSRWNLMIWRNDTGGALLHLVDLELPMPVFELTFSNLGDAVHSVIGLGNHRRELNYPNPGDPLFEAQTWKLTLLNSLGVPSSKTVTLYGDPKLTLTNSGAPNSLFDFSIDGPGKISLLEIDDLGD